MPRMSHGSTVSLEAVRASRAAINALNESLGAPFALAELSPVNRFDYMFPTLQGPESLLPPGDETIANLKLLGRSMRDTTPDDGKNSKIPSAYTYFGQFVDHDITLDAVSDGFGHIDDTFVPTVDEVRAKMENLRTPELDLDSVYGGNAVRDGARMHLGMVTATGDPVPGKDAMNDLPRTAPNPFDAERDRAAQIGDFRNDENLNISQLQVAFLRAHNEIVDAVNNFDASRRILRRLYQWIVVNDFLTRIVGQETVETAKAGNSFFTAGDGELYMPLEFSVAAYRFGHSMVRDRYEYNKYMGKNGAKAAGSLTDLFTYTALTGQIGPAGQEHETLPDFCVIQWENFVNPNVNAARRIDTRLVEPLYALQDITGIPIPDFKGQLAVMNLLRGYKLRMPTGQAVASFMGKPVVDSGLIREVIGANAGRSDLSSAERDALVDSGFHQRTPLWFYILAEAELMEQGMRLGPVGGTIVAEVLIGITRHSPDSIFDLPADWNPSHLRHQLQRPVNPNFHLMALLRLAGVHS